MTIRILYSYVVAGQPNNHQQRFAGAVSPIPRRRRVRSVFAGLESQGALLAFEFLLSNPSPDLLFCFFPSVGSPGLGRPFVDDAPSGKRAVSASRSAPSGVFEIQQWQSHAPGQQGTVRLVTVHGRTGAGLRSAVFWLIMRNAE